MPTTTFDYKVRDADGRLVKGQLEADSVPLVAARLRDMGYAPVEIKPVSINLKREINIPGITDRVALKDVALMSRQLATMVSAGLTLVRALGVLADQIESKPLREAMLQVRQDVEQGSSLSTSLEKLPKVFPPLYIAMVRAGEVGGQLDSVLLKLSTTLEKQVELRQKVRSAMAYPAIVLCAVIVIVTAMMIFIVPIFKRLFSSLNGTLPAADPDRHRHLQRRRQRLAARRHSGHRHDRGPDAPVDRDAGRQEEVGRVQASPAHIRCPCSQGRACPVLHDLLIAAVGRRAGHRSARHRRRQRGQPDRRRRSYRSPGGRPRRQDPVGRPRPVPGHADHGDPDDRDRRGVRCSRRHARQSRDVLRQRGERDRRQPDLDPRAVDHRVHGCLHRGIVISLYLPMFDYVKLLQQPGA